MCLHDMDFSFPRWIRSTWYFPAAIPYAKRNKKRPDLILICEFPLPPFYPLRFQRHWKYLFFYEYNSCEKFFIFPRNRMMSLHKPITLYNSNDIAGRPYFLYISTINCLLYVNHILFTFNIYYMHTCYTGL